METKTIKSPGAEHHYFESYVWETKTYLSVLCYCLPKLDEPTKNKLIKFAELAGFGGIRFASISPKSVDTPNDITKLSVQGDNLKYLKKLQYPVVFIWGDNGVPEVLYQKLTRMFPSAYCFGYTKKHNPISPKNIPLKGLKLELYKSNKYL